MLVHDSSSHLWLTLSFRYCEAQKEFVVELVGHLRRSLRLDIDAIRGFLCHAPRGTAGSCTGGTAAPGCAVLVHATIRAVSYIIGGVNGLPFDEEKRSRYD